MAKWVFPTEKGEVTWDSAHEDPDKAWQEYQQAQQAQPNLTGTQGGKSLEQRQVEEVQSPRWQKFQERDLPMMMGSAALTGGTGALMQKVATTLAPKVPAGLQVLLKAFPVLGEVFGNVAAKTGETLGYEGQLPSQREVKGAAAAPPVGRMAGKAIGALGKGVEQLLPGYRWGLKDLAVKGMEQLPGKINAPASTPLYQQLDEWFKRTGSPMIPTPKMAAQTAESQAQLGTILRSLRENKMSAVADDIESLMTQPGGMARADLQTLFENLKRMGHNLSKVRAVSPDKGLVEKIYGAAREDIRDAGTSYPKAALLAEATQRRSKETAVDQLRELVRKGTARRPVDAERVPRPGMVQEQLQDPKNFATIRDRLTPAENQMLEQELQKLVKIAPLPADSSWYNWLRRTIGGTVLGGGIGTMMGNPAMGSAAGALGGAAAAEGVEQLFKTPMGRKIAQRIYQNRLGGPGSAILGSAVGQGVD